MRRPKEAETAIPPLVQRRWLEDRIGALHADDEAERRLAAGLLTGMLGVPLCPFRHVCVELGRVANDADVALMLQGMIIGQLSLRDAVRLCRCGKINVRFGMSGRPRDHRGEAECNPPPAHLGEGHGALPTSLARSEMLLRTDCVR